MERRKSAGIPTETFTTVQLHHLLADMFGAGTDTALTTIKWIVLYLILYPDVQVSILKHIHTHTWSSVE
jgi:ecdysteroid 25-hydroxylase CYP306A1